ncbi:hypothetical protein [Limnoglobus roseus]|uniref:Uncharacterized protein n=1 Tax=Limnoglobus roseus TaxID=2598579 RepID=A0A5C1AAD0_9BACT|nr:hypothetical protein [Limnoglobus roseus]QEL15133.1 hypothetical protein PX52LOC_02042 [Limnoglobus roseus]
MAVTTTIWNPSGHPIHQLIQGFDVVIAATTVIRAEAHRLNYVLNQNSVEFPAPGDEALARFRQLVSEYRAAWAELFVRDHFGPGEVARQLPNEVTACFVRGG